MKKHWDNFLDQYGDMSPVMQATTWCLAFLVAYLIWGQTFGAIAVNLNAKADAIDRKVALVRQYSTLSPSLQTTVLSIGDVEYPSSQGNLEVDLESATNEILNDSSLSIRKQQTNTLSGKQYKAGSLGGSAKARPIATVRSVMTLELPASQLGQLIAKLESHPIIDSVSEVLVSRTNTYGVLKVTVEVEAWRQGDRSKGSS